MSMVSSTRGGFYSLAAAVVLLSITVSMQASTGIRTFYIDESAVKGDCTIEVQGEWDPTYEVILKSSAVTAAAPQGFTLLDGTLEIGTSNIENTGIRKMQVRIRYDSARLRTLGGRVANPPRLLRLRRVGRVRRWRPIRDALRLRGLRARRKTGPATFELGHYGTDWTNEYVWAVTDAPGTFAIGIPEPISLLCMAGGVGVLVLRRRKRSACK
jgi:hypothetical protein